MIESKINKDIYNLILTNISTANLSTHKNEDNKFFITNTMYLTYFGFSGNIILTISSENNKKNLLTLIPFKNLKEFFESLSEFDKDDKVKAYFYLKGVYEDLTNEELFNK